MPTISNSITSLQKRVLHYLSNPNGSPERLTMLRDMFNSGWFEALYDQDFIVAVKKYVQNNSRGFCPAGIERFLTAFPEFAPPRCGKITVTLEIDVENINPESFGTVASADQGFVADLMPHIRKFESNQTGLRTTGVKWTEYSAKRT